MIYMVDGVIVTEELYQEALRDGLTAEELLERYIPKAKNYPLTEPEKIVQAVRVFVQGGCREVENER